MWSDFDASSDLEFWLEGTRRPSACLPFHPRLIKNCGSKTKGLCEKEGCQVHSDPEIQMCLGTVRQKPYLVSV